MIYIFTAAALLIGYLMGYLFSVKREKEIPEPEELSEPVSDAGVAVALIDLVKYFYSTHIVDIGTLAVEHEIDRKEPVFFECYQELLRRSKERYFTGLLHILEEQKSEFLRNIRHYCPQISDQDLLLLIFMDMQLDNKTMAELLLVSLETLKKRKFRMKGKYKHLQRK